MLYLTFPEWISPTLVPGLPIRWYGIMYLVGFAITYGLFTYQTRRRSPAIEQEEITNLFFWGIVGLLVGARLLFVLVGDTTGELIRKPWLIIWPFRDGRFTGIQGMSYHGGLIGAVVAVVLYGHRRRLELLECGDMLAAAAPLGYAIGRLGNFINGELYGRVTTLPWGMIYPTARRNPAQQEWVRNVAAEVGLPLSDPNQMVNLPRHPSQLYEAVLEGVLIWLLLWFVFRRNRPFPGFITGAYLVGYGITRFFAEYFRQPDYGVGFAMTLGAEEPIPQLLTHAGAITVGQLFSVGMVLAGIGVTVTARLLFKPAPTIVTFEVEH